MFFFVFETISNSSAWVNPLVPSYEIWSPDRVKSSRVTPLSQPSRYCLDISVFHFVLTLGTENHRPMGRRQPVGVQGKGGLSWSEAGASRLFFYSPTSQTSGDDGLRKRSLEKVILYNSLFLGWSECELVVMKSTQTKKNTVKIQSKVKMNNECIFDF